MIQLEKQVRGRRREENYIIREIHLRVKNSNEKNKTTCKNRWVI